MTPTAYPLLWPAGWPRTEASRREAAAFKQTLAGALSNLKKQVGLLPAKGLILSSNYTLGAENPPDCGVVAYFTYQETAVAIPCDRWRRLEHNVHAIALTVEAMRGMERWGAKHMIKAMFSGFKMLPSARSDWAAVLGVSRHAAPDQVKSAWRALCTVNHPDRGGDRAKWDEVMQAWAEYRAEKGEA